MSETVLAIVGSRQFDDYDHFCYVVDKYIKYHRLTIQKIISGDAPGIDQMAEDYAIQHGFAFEYFPADWDNLGPAAGFIRNDTIVTKSTHILALWDGESHGTKDTVDKGLKKRRFVTTAKIVKTKRRYYSARWREIYKARNENKEAA